MLIMIFSGYIYMKRYYKCIDSKFNWYNIDFILPIICFSFIFGIRYNVGNDYMSYLDIYEGYAHYYTIRDDLEIGFEFVTRLMAETGLHYSIYFGLIAFLQIFLIIHDYVWSFFRMDECYQTIFSLVFIRIRYPFYQAKKIYTLYAMCCYRIYTSQNSTSANSSIFHL